MLTDAEPHTPVRALGVHDDLGYRLLRDAESSYRDGGEQRVLELIAAAQNLHSTSDELIVSATTWAERYHLTPNRANVLRALELPADARVLEIGAGCGAITRYLGESCAVVDALEPVPSRAAAAAARTRDLDGVQVFVGMLDDVPAEPTYDIVIVVGVLEYVGGGVAAREPYLSFLDQVNERLVDGGTLVLAIENRLGVKYLVGSPEDHTGRYFDSVEGYPVGGKARTFSRLELESLIEAAGLMPNTLVAFPDYKLTRTVMSQMPAGAQSLLHRIPRMPSPDWTRKRPKLAHEGRVWRSLVEGGLAAEFGNSFLVLAGKGAPSTFWPQDRLAAFYSTGRRPELSTKTLVTSGEDGVRFTRRGLVDGPHQVGSIRLLESVAGYEDGHDLLDVVAEGGLAAARPLIEAWLELLRDAARIDEHVPMDLVPHNIVVDDEGTLHVIDIELVDDQMDIDTVIRRGVFWLADRVASIAPPERWSPLSTVREVAIALGTFAGLPEDGSWIGQVLANEVEVAVLVRPGPPTGTSMQQWRAKLAVEFDTRVDRKLDSLPVGERLWSIHQRKTTTTADAAKRRSTRITALERDLARVKAQHAQVQADLARANRNLATATAQVKTLRSQTLRARVRHRAGVVLPPGTRRRALAKRAYTRLR